jgi:hypothetical protein
MLSSIRRADVCHFSLYRHFRANHARRSGLISSASHFCPFSTPAGLTLERPLQADSNISSWIHRFKDGTMQVLPSWHLLVQQTLVSFGKL